jgi:hypothetical protein
MCALAVLGVVVPVPVLDIGLVEVVVVIVVDVDAPPPPIAATLEPTASPTPKVNNAAPGT